MVTAPTINPVSAPNATPLIMTIAVAALKFGSMKNAALPATARAHIVATVTSSLAFGFLFSYRKKNGIIASRSISMDMK